MRKLFWLILVLIVLWCGYWVFASIGLKSGTNAWLDDRRSAGWAADVSSISSGGFPVNLHTTLNDLRLADPSTGVAWSGADLSLQMPAYKPYRATIAFPEQHVLSTPLDTFTFTNTNLSGTLELQPNAALGLNQAVFGMDDLDVTDQAGDTLALETGTLDVLLTDADAHLYTISFNATNLTPGSMFDFIQDRQDRLPDVFQTASIDAIIAFDRPWDRAALEQARPQPRQIDLKLAEAKWGQLEIAVAGNLTIDARGIPTGPLTIKAKNWRDILALAVENGVLAANVAQSVEGLLAGMARASGNANTLDLPLKFKGGQTWLTFIPLGPAPVIRLR